MEKHFNYDIKIRMTTTRSTGKDNRALKLIRGIGDKQKVNQVSEGKERKKQGKSDKL